MTKPRFGGSQFQPIMETFFWDPSTGVRNCVFHSPPPLEKCDPKFVPKCSIFNLILMQSTECGSYSTLREQWETTTGLCHWLQVLYGTVPPF